MKRITVEQVVEAFNVTGAIPKTGRYTERDNDGRICACGLGAIYLAENPEEGRWMYQDGINEYFIFKYGRDYQLGFVHGFDGHEKRTWEDEDYDFGYEDGAKARKVLNPEGN